MRPDLCGVVYELLDPTTAIGLCDPARPEAWKEGASYRLLGGMIQAGVSVVVAVGSTKNVLLAPGRTVESIWPAIGEAIRRKRDEWQLQAIRPT